MGDINITSVENNDDNTINLEITSYQNSVDVSFVESIESVVAVHNNDKNAHETLQEKIALKANTSDITTSLATKVDIVSGKTLSSNDLTDILKANYDTAYTNNHIHSNKTLIDTITGSGDGNSFLSNDGSYKSVNGTALFGTCSVDSTASTKTVALAGFTLSKGATIQVTFVNTNTTIAPALNVESSGVILIASEVGIVCSVNNPFYVPAGATIEFTYNGTYWVYKNKVVSSYVNGVNWYKQYSNGWIEQNIITPVNSNGLRTIQLLKAMRTTDYSVYTTRYCPDTSVAGVGVGNQTLTSVDVWIGCTNQDRILVFGY